MKAFFTVIFISMLGIQACSEMHQQADSEFVPKNKHRSFSEKNGPVVFVDEGHHNFHTMDGRYKPFAQVLVSDGYQVKPSKGKLTLAHLKHADILVVANALDGDRRDWQPPFGDAFDSQEIEAVEQWVKQGGALFLVADHTPFPRAIDKLASGFGFKFSDGHVGNAIFSRENNGLMPHSITYEVQKDGKETKIEDNVALSMQHFIETDSQAASVTKVRTFGGSAFEIPSEAVSLLTLGERAVSITPAIPFQVTSKTPRISVNGWSQGAVLEVGKGRVAVFAEAMVFSSQIETKTGKKFGFTSKGAEQNEQFLLNVMHWLSGII